MNDHQKNKGGNNKFLESNQNESTTYQNIFDIAMAVLQRQFMSTYSKNKNREISNK
jgi:hypothetical protein